jgi:hypothetical protein
MDVIERDDETETDVLEDAPIEQLPDGVYLHMPEATYHGQNRLSGSGFKKLAISEADFWASSWMNPDKKEKRTKALSLGSAYHTARLEPQKMVAQYVRDISPDDYPGGALTNATEIRAQIAKLVPQKEDYPGALTTAKAVKDALGDMGQPKTGTAQECIDRLKSVRPEVVIWADIVAKFEAEKGPISAPSGETVLDMAKRLVGYGYTGKIMAIERAKFDQERGDREAIPGPLWDQMLKDVALLHSNPDVSAALSGGMAEVSVLWTDEGGAKMKCRLDQISPHSIIDLKTFDNSNGKEVRDCIVDAIKYNRYYISVAMQREAGEMIRSGALEVMDAKSEDEVRFFAELTRRSTGFPVQYIFQQKSGIPNVFLVNFKFRRDESLRAAEAGVDQATADYVRETYGDSSIWYRKAQYKISEGLDVYARCMKRYGENEPWSPLEPILDVSDDVFSSYWLDEV